jgi:hypothetical protein
MSKSYRKHDRQYRRSTRSADINQHAERHKLREVRSREQLKQDLKEVGFELAYSG